MSDGISDMYREEKKAQAELMPIMAVEKWGLVSQMLLAMEECGELIAVINQFLRGRKNKSDIAEEIADVEIMCAQLRHMIGNELVDREKHLKLKRLEKRLEDCK